MHYTCSVSHISRLAKRCTLALSIMLFSVTASASIILAPGSIWQYTFADPTANTGWNNLGFDDSGWNTGAAPFSNCDACPDPNFNKVTNWSADGLDGDDLWVRAQIDLTNIDLSTLAWDLGVDNGFKLYANGIQIGAGNAEGFTYRWEYSGNFTGALLVQGINVIAVALEDHGGATAFDMQVRGDIRVAAPEPGSMLLLLLGLSGFVVSRRRH